MGSYKNGGYYKYLIGGVFLGFFVFLFHVISFCLFVCLFGRGPYMVPI